MRSRAILTFVLILFVAFSWHASGRVGQGGGAPVSTSGDTNGDLQTDISDAIHLLSFLFTGGPPPVPCEAQSGVSAHDVSFDPTGSTLAALNVQAALIEMDQKVADLTARNADLLARVAALEGLKPLAKPVQIDVAEIPAGSFIMGSPETEVGHWPGDEAIHRVNITKPFLMGTTPVTQAQFEAVAGYNASVFIVRPSCPDCPVEVANWYQVLDFLAKLTERQRAAEKIGPKDFYRLPTESEWEYACRAGTTTRFSFGDVNECTNDAGFCPTASEYMWYAGNSGPAEGPKPVARKKPNAWGLYDMHGNVYQICSDWYGPYPVGELNDPTGAASGPGKVIRGGNYPSPLSRCRSAHRTYMQVEGGGYGIRVVLEVVP